MRRAILAFVGTVAVLVLLLSFKTHGVALRPVPAAIATSSGTTSSSATSSSTTSTGTKTVTGDAADTRYGPVQVRITVSNGRITAADAVVYPQESPRDVEINQYAVPVLDQEAVKSGNANIDMISGATFTSEGYLQSLQSAIDKAKA